MFSRLISKIGSNKISFPLKFTSFNYKHWNFRASERIMENISNSLSSLSIYEPESSGEFNRIWRSDQSKWSFQELGVYETILRNSGNKMFRELELVLKDWSFKVFSKELLKCRNCYSYRFFSKTLININYVIE